MLQVWSPDQEHLHHWDLLEMQILTHHPRHTESETQIHKSVLTGFPGDSNSCSSLRITAFFINFTVTLTDQ